MNRLTAVFLLVVGMIALSEAHWYALYPDQWQGGNRVEGNTDEGCQKATIPVASVNTGGGCIMLCNRSKCKGRCVRVMLDTPERLSECRDHGNLEDCDFHHKTKSVKGC